MRVFLTPRADRKLQAIWEYLKKEFGEKSAIAFKSKAQKFIATLERFPEIGIMEEPSKEIRSFPITNKTRIFYRVKDQKIFVLTFFDVRQNPKKKIK